MSELHDALLGVLDVKSGKDTDHDPYAALCAMFDIANALDWLDPNSVPAHWGFSPSPMGGLDYAECHNASNGECGAHPSGECSTTRGLLYECGVVMSDPYGYPSGARAERALVELGNVLNPYALLYRD